ncbi:MAG: 6-carboxytetrahydropterin synthase QueD [Candidatus Saelkia tenebricola]|nr:6-carboxytetrahydropterin synthase QueD [Candidatus Saelkia tenebricola]
MYQISVKSNFSAAHNLREYNGKCENLHGHNWYVEVFIESEVLNKEGMVIDFKDVKSILKKTLECMDHKYINEIEPFNKINPTSENIAEFIFNKINPEFKSRSLNLAKVDVWETDSSRASYYEE